MSTIAYGWLAPHKAADIRCISYAAYASQNPEVAVGAFRTAMADPRARLSVMQIMRDGKLTARH